MAPVQHASSPSTTSASSRLHTNTPFPGTVAAPRSAMPPASASAHLRSMQYLSRLTERTPASFVKLPFPSNTTVHWLRLQKPDSHPPPELGQDHTQPTLRPPLEPRPLLRTRAKAGTPYGPMRSTRSSPTARTSKLDLAATTILKPLQTTRLSGWCAEPSSTHLPFVLSLRTAWMHQRQTRPSTPLSQISGSSQPSTMMTPTARQDIIRGRPHSRSHHHKCCSDAGHRAIGRSRRRHPQRGSSANYPHKPYSLFAPRCGTLAALGIRQGARAALRVRHRRRGLLSALKCMS